MCLKEKKLSWQVFLIHSTDEIINLVRTTFVYLKAITSRITFALLFDCSWRLHGSGFVRLQQDVWTVFGGTCSYKGPENCLTCLRALQTPVNLARSFIYGLSVWNLKIYRCLHGAWHMECREENAGQQAVFVNILDYFTWPKMTINKSNFICVAEANPNPFRVLIFA